MKHRHLGKVPRPVPLRCCAIEERVWLRETVKFYSQDGANHVTSIGGLKCDGMSLEQWLSGEHWNFTRKELQPSKDVIFFCTGHSPTPNPFCFDCAFLPKPHKLCLIHSLQQQKCDLVLKDGGRSGKIVEKREGGGRTSAHLAQYSTD